MAARRGAARPGPASFGGRTDPTWRGRCDQWEIARTGRGRPGRAVLRVVPDTPGRHRDTRDRRPFCASDLRFYAPTRSTSNNFSDSVASVGARAYGYHYI